MKRAAVILLTACMLAGCGMANEGSDRVLALRAKLIAGQGCTFETVITADYGDELYSFTMECETDRQGELVFTVTEPQTIAGISGTVSASGGKLTFDDTALAFDLLADGQLSPVSAPWLMVRTLQGGYVTSCGQDGELVRASIDDSYADDAFHLDVWLRDDLPVRAEILYRDRRIVSLEVRNFKIL